MDKLTQRDYPFARVFLDGLDGSFDSDAIPWIFRQYDVDPVTESLRAFIFSSSSLVAASTEAASVFEPT